MLRAVTRELGGFKEPEFLLKIISVSRRKLSPPGRDHPVPELPEAAVTGSVLGTPRSIRGERTSSDRSPAPRLGPGLRRESRWQRGRGDRSLLLICLRPTAKQAFGHCRGHLAQSRGAGASHAGISLGAGHAA